MSDKVVVWKIPELGEMFFAQAGTKLALKGGKPYTMCCCVNMLGVLASEAARGAATKGYRWVKVDEA